jgi:hypothetical protein
MADNLSPNKRAHQDRGADDNDENSDLKRQKNQEEGDKPMTLLEAYEMIYQPVAFYEGSEALCDYLLKDLGNFSARTSWVCDWLFMAYHCHSLCR